jgi:hypothetical protein
MSSFCFWLIPEDCPKADVAAMSAQAVTAIIVFMSFSIVWFPDQPPSFSDVPTFRNDLAFQILSVKALSAKDSEPMKFQFSAIHVAFSALALTCIAVPTPSAARDYPYCIKRWGEAGPGDCRFTSFRQCQATSSGLNADCYVNPRLAYGRQQQRQTRQYDRAYRDGW